MIDMNKILCFTLPISLLLHIIFQNSTYSFIFCPILGVNIGSAMWFLWGCNDLKELLLSHLRYGKEYDTNLLHLDSDTILCRFKKCEKDSKHDH